MKRPSACEGDLHPFDRAAMKRPARGGDLKTSGATQPAAVEPLVAEVRELGHLPVQSDPLQRNKHGMIDIAIEDVAGSSLCQCSDAEKHAMMKEKRQRLGAWTPGYCIWCGKPMPAAYQAKEAGTTLV